MDFKQLSIQHGEKLVTLIVAVLCLWAIYGNVVELQTDSGMTQTTRQTLSSIEHRLKTMDQKKRA